MVLQQQNRAFGVILKMKCQHPALPVFAFGAKRERVAAGVQKQEIWGSRMMAMRTLVLMMTMPMPMLMAHLGICEVDDGGDDDDVQEYACDGVTSTRKGTRQLQEITMTPSHHCRPIVDSVIAARRRVMIYRQSYRMHVKQVIIPSWGHPRHSPRDAGQALEHPAFSTSSERAHLT
jgi:hypothetical protein